MARNALSCTSRFGCFGAVSKPDAYRLDMGWEVVVPGCRTVELLCTELGCLVLGVTVAGLFLICTRALQQGSPEYRKIG
ncbi:hypothetical protein [Archangium sp.]|uniref:hypothetical protein n=1 Tax=Archangium sp. TaxID=1872627 RepID=UPI00286A1AD1|nr:hypothetical protein [Archangium sp.]